MTTAPQQAPSAVRRFLEDDGTPPGRPRRPEYRHGTVLPLAWFHFLYNPGRWRVGHWALFGCVMVAIADLLALFYVFNVLGDVGEGSKIEIEVWLLIAGLGGFATITAALWAIWKGSGRWAGVIALLLGLALGAAPAWLVGNTLVQLVVNGGTLPDAPPMW
ncbi:MAG: hypothetical protein Q4E05_05590 [Pseudoclavibacter sp.]|nr:hypothetical protein [Pseudoclavibacter sp.]